MTGLMHCARTCGNRRGFSRDSPGLKGPQSHVSRVICLPIDSEPTAIGWRSAGGWDGPSRDVRGDHIMLIMALVVVCVTAYLLSDPKLRPPKNDRARLG